MPRPGKTSKNWFVSGVGAPHSGDIMEKIVNFRICKLEKILLLFINILSIVLKTIISFHQIYNIIRVLLVQDEQKTRFFTISYINGKNWNFAGP